MNETAIKLVLPGVAASVMAVSLTACGSGSGIAPIFGPPSAVNHADLAECRTEVATVETAEEASYAMTSHYEANVAKLVGNYLHSLPVYVASYDTLSQKVVLNAKGAGLPGCLAR